MAVFDLTHPIKENMPVFPGEPGPSIRNVATHDIQGYRVKWLGMGSHTGTHIDAPFHLLRDGKTLDQYPVSHFTGLASVLTIPRETKVMDAGFIKLHEDVIGSSAYLLLRTGWSRFWGTVDYFSGFPVLSEEAARWLTGFPLHGIGMDTISADPVNSHSLANHHILLGAGFVIVENLNFPEVFNSSKGVFHCFPLHLEEGDGSPVRAVLSTDDP